MRACLEHRVLVCLAVLVGLSGRSTANDPRSPAVEFNRDIRPILSDNCFQCHGPDAAKRKKNLRLDQESGARKVVVPARPEESELFLRLRDEDDAHRMPPPASGRRLTPQQIEQVRRWIEQGARWQLHWSLLPPRRPA